MKPVLIKKVRINGYTYKVCFVEPHTLPEKCIGQTFYDERMIKISTALDETATKITVTHELVHAILGTQGRSYQKNFDLEDVCEFVGYNLDQINKLLKDILGEEGTDKNE